MLQQNSLGSQSQPQPNFFFQRSQRNKESYKSVLGNADEQGLSRLRYKSPSQISHSLPQQIIVEVERLKPQHLFQLRQLIDQKLMQLKGASVKSDASRITGSYAPKDRSKENEWLRQHSAEYAGQWVALDGERLLGHGPKLKEVAEAVKQSGVTDALYIHLEPIDALPWAGF